MNNDEYPLVSVLITCYNRATSIGQAIESALAQDYKNLEVIVTDNCSTDNSDEIIKRYCDDKRVVYSRNETNIGMAGNFKKGIYELCSGKYFVSVCSDDYLINDKFISQAVALTKKYDNILVVKGKYSRMDESNGILVKSNFDASVEFYEGKDWLKYSLNLPFSEIYETLGWTAVFVERNAFIELDAFEYPTPNIDVFSNIKLLLKGNIAFVDDYSYFFRTLSNRVAYLKDDSRETYLGIFNTVAMFAKQDIGNNKVMKNFYHNFFDYVINYFMRFVYRYDKKEFQVLVQHLEKYYPRFLFTVRKSKEWKLYSILYYNKTFGKYLSRLKNAIYNKPVIS